MTEYIRVGLRVILIMMLVIEFESSLAAHVEPTRRTNINEIDPLFEENIKNYKDFEKSVDDGKQDAISRIDSTKIANENETRGEATRLEKISANEMESEGQKAKMKELWIDEYYIDYSKPGAKKTKEDMEEIASAVDKLMLNILGKLKDIVDCKTVKGNKEIEPQYIIEMQKRATQDRVYDQYFCEQLRNRYNCSDTLTMKCKRTGLKYGEWQARKIRFNGHFLHNQKMDWGYAVHWKKGRWGWHITPYHPPKGIFGWPEQVDSCWRENPAAIIADARSYIAQHLGVKLEQIGEQVDFPPSGRGVEGTPITSVGARWRVVWEEYEFGYHYRDASPICEEWDEVWNEACNLW